MCQKPYAYRFPSHYKVIASNELFKGTGMSRRIPTGSYRFLPVHIRCKSIVLRMIFIGDSGIGF